MPTSYKPLIEGTWTPKDRDSLQSTITVHGLTHVETKAHGPLKIRLPLNAKSIGVNTASHPGLTRIRFEHAISFGVLEEEYEYDDPDQPELVYVPMIEGPWTQDDRDMLQASAAMLAYDVVETEEYGLLDFHLPLNAKSISVSSPIYPDLRHIRFEDAVSFGDLVEEDELL